MLSDSLTCMGFQECWHPAASRSTGMSEYRAHTGAALLLEAERSLAFRCPLKFAASSGCRKLFSLQQSLFHPLARRNIAQNLGRAHNPPVPQSKNRHTSSIFRWFHGREALTVQFYTLQPLFGSLYQPADFRRSAGDRAGIVHRLGGSPPVRSSAHPAGAEPAFRSVYSPNVKRDAGHRRAKRRPAGAGLSIETRGQYANRTSTVACFAASFLFASWGEVRFLPAPFVHWPHGQRFARRSIFNRKNSKLCSKLLSSVRELPAYSGQTIQEK